MPTADAPAGKPAGSTSAHATSAPSTGKTSAGQGGTASGHATRGSDDLWYLATPDGQQHGPISKNELDRWVLEGRVQPQFNVFSQGWTEWRPVTDMYPQLVQPPAMGMSSPGGMGTSGTGLPMGMTPVGPMDGMPMSDPMAGQFAGGGGMSASPYAAPMAMNYNVRRKSDADVPGILAVTFGGIALACTLLACVVQFVGILALLLAITGLILSFFAKPPLKTIGIVLNSLVLVACAVVVVIAIIAVVFGVAFFGAAANRGQGFGP